MTDRYYDSCTNHEENAFLQISSWRGISIGATHFYGKIVSGDIKVPSVEIFRCLTSEEAKIINNAHKAYKYGYEEGDLYPGFDDRESLIEQAKLIWKESFPNQKRLLLGDSCYCEPMLIIDER
jgi:hypothetical protein